ncbi:MAG: S8 family serine peptidase [Betaproteobacteria bacterium]|nr:S8 family serine peptidase [Betaproteobacteria bacterium]
MHAAALACGLLGAAVAGWGAPIEDAPTALIEKADPWVMRKLAGGGRTEFLAILHEKADLAAATGLRGKNDKGRLVVANLREVAGRSQGPLLEWLSARGIEHRAFWIANMVLVRADAAAASELAARGDIARLAANPAVRLPDPQPAAAADAPGTGPKAATAVAAVEWGVAKVRAPELWAAGFVGQGIVIGGADTGIDWTHPALRNKYRGWNGTAADHNYNWHDAIHALGSSCGGNAPAPCDDGSHGTHTMGTMVGDDGGGNAIGVAPGARWIACRNMDQGVGTPATYAECFQWFLAPTDSTGSNPDASRAPHVINNSWSCPASEGCTDPNVLRTVVENVVAAGIAVVVSAGNYGAGCSSVSTSAAIYDKVITVGATDAADDIAGFSGRGPVTVDGSNRLKPDVSAPGVSVRSAVSSGGYATSNGTSMAGPHVAGAAALLLSAVPALVGQPAALKSRMGQNAVPRTTAQDCGDVPGAAVPNNTFGWGRLDAKAAYDNGAAIPPSALDVDASNNPTRYDALTDGILVLRYLFGLTGAPLVDNALGPTATRTDPDALRLHIAGIGAALDIDGDGQIDALTDGLLILRYMFGMRDTALVADVVTPGAPRTPTEIEAHLHGLMP